jgi:hypothetical protein
MRASCVVAVVVGLAGTAVADPTGRLTGTLTDSTTGKPVGDVVLFVTRNGAEEAVTTDADGRYSIELPPGGYDLVFARDGATRETRHVSLAAGATFAWDAKVDVPAGEVIHLVDAAPEQELRGNEVIVVHGKIPAPPVLPKPKNYVVTKAPPYSERAIMSDAWTSAFMLLDVTETGEVARVKFLNKPGFDLEPIAIKESFKLRFEPARDASGKPIETWLVWKIEWPGSWWLVDMEIPGTMMPSENMMSHVPCAGSGPWHMGSIHPIYRDCRKPDMKNVDRAPWILPERK